jgi:hypothetical protein
MILNYYYQNRALARIQGEEFFKYYFLEKKGSLIFWVLKNECEEDGCGKT